MAPTRRINDIVTLARLQKQMDDVHSRVYNGLGKELREELHKAMGSTNKLMVGILVALVLSLAGIIVEGRLESSRSTAENDRNYAAIERLDQKLQDHMNAMERD